MILIIGLLITFLTQFTPVFLPHIHPNFQKNKTKQNKTRIGLLPESQNHDHVDTPYLFQNTHLNAFYCVRQKNSCLKRSMAIAKPVIGL